MQWYQSTGGSCSYNIITRKTKTMNENNDFDVNKNQKISYGQTVNDNQQQFSGAK